MRRSKKLCRREHESIDWFQEESSAGRVQERKERERSQCRPEMRFILTSMEEGAIRRRFGVLPQGVCGAGEMLLREAGKSADNRTMKTKADK